MDLTVLVDNNTSIDRYFLAEPAVSYFIEDEDFKILFDTGYSDVFYKNACKIGIHLNELDFIVISHGHNDHTWGLLYLIPMYSECIAANIPLKKPELIAHPNAFDLKRHGEEEIGSLLPLDKLKTYFKTSLTKNPVWLTKKLVFLGEIERKNSFEAQLPIGKTIKDGEEIVDFVLDDSALVYKSSEGLVIITACSHAGICNIIEYAKKVCNENKIIDIIGGFHLLNPPEEQMEYTLNYMKKINIKQIHACHCTDLNSKIELSKVVKINEVGVGLKISYL